MGKKIVCYSCWGIHDANTSGNTPEDYEDICSNCDSNNISEEFDDNNADDLYDKLQETLDLCKTYEKRIFELKNELRHIDPHNKTLTNGCLKREYTPYNLGINDNDVKLLKLIKKKFYLTPDRDLENYYKLTYEEEELLKDWF